MLALLMLLLPAVIAPAGAAGQERARPDPDSPAGVEDELPLDQARDDAAGEPRKGKAGGPKAPLFGEGIRKSDQAAGQPANRAARARSAKPHARTTPASPPRRKGREPGKPKAAEMSVASNGPEKKLWLLAAAVLLVGAALGLALRRLRATRSQ